MEDVPKFITLAQAQNIWNVMAKLLSQQYGVEIKYAVREKEKDVPTVESKTSTQTLI